MIVGGGLAGHRAAKALADDGFGGKITLVGDEPHYPYDRPPLSKKRLSGEIDDDACAYALDGLDEVEWRLGVAAKRLDLERRRVVLVDGAEIEYDGLVIATGRAARRWPNLPAIEGFHTLRSLDDCHALAAAATPGKRVVIVGGGFIGCEVAATLRGLGVDQVTIVELADQVLGPVGSEAGVRAAAVHRGNGVDVRSGVSVAGFDGQDRVEAVRLSDGEALAAEVVLLALGSVPNSEWLADCGLELAAGAVLCDEYCFAVGADDVVAAGDIAAWPLSDKHGVVSIEHWTNARDMGPTAARNLVAPPADRKPYTSVPTFWSDQYDLKIKSCGFVKGADRLTIVDEDPEKNALVVEAHRGDTLVGAITINRNRALLGYRRKLEEELSS